MNKRIRGTVIWFIVLLAVWEAAARSGLVPVLVLPPLETVFCTFGTEPFSAAAFLKVRPYHSDSFFSE